MTPAVLCFILTLTSGREGNLNVGTHEHFNEFLFLKKPGFTTPPPTHRQNKEQTHKK